MPPVFSGMAPSGNCTGRKRPRYAKHTKISVVAYYLAEKRCHTLWAA